MTKQEILKKLPYILSVTVTAAGALVMASWIFDISVFKSILPQWVTMKFSTALCFSLSGITLYFIVEMQRGRIDLAQVVIPITTLIIFLFMATLLFSSVLQIHTGIEDLFVREPYGAAKSIVPGRPSIGTMVNFVLIAIAGILATFRLRHLKKYLFGIGFIVWILGCVGVMGYILNRPMLYYAVEGYSTAMAFHTAILFVMLGVGSMLLRKQ